MNLYTAHDYWLICQQNNLLKRGYEKCEDASCVFCALMCRKPPQLWRRTREFGEALREIDFLIAPSNYVKRRVSKSLEVKTVTIPNFVPEPIDPLGPSSISDFFLYAGVLEKHKGILDLINIYKEIGGDIDKKLLVAGDGSLRNNIKEFVKKHRLESKIVLLGWVDHSLLYRLLRDADALVLPSICPENCPLIAIEAFSVGTPVIASNKGGLPEIVGAVDGGLVYNSADRARQILLNF